MTPAVTGCGSAIGGWAVAAWLALAGGPAHPALRAQAAPAPVHEQATQAARPEAARSARLTVNVPQDDTVLSLEGRVIVGMGTTREVETPPLGPQERRSLTLTASWNPNTYTTMTRTKSVSLRAGERVAVDSTREDPGDRVRVIYVPTPADVANEMVTLAGATAADVVFEPGCGDARITIAAIKDRREACHLCRPRPRARTGVPRQRPTGRPCRPD